MHTAKTQPTGGVVRVFLSLVGIMMLGFCLSRAAWAQPRPPAPPPRPPVGPLDMNGIIGPGVADSEPEPAEPADITPKNDKGYDEDPVDAAGQRKNQLKVGQIILAGKFAAGDQEVFDDYYNKYVLARWSLVENLPSLPAYRQDLRNQLKRAKSGQVHDELSALALEYMNKLAAGNYHPTVRINAMLMIGDLNGVEQSGNEPPAPLDSAVPVLLAAVENSDLSDALRAAAMVGILRHAAAGVRDDNTRKAMIAAMLKIVEEDIPAGAAAPVASGSSAKPSRPWG